MTAILENALRWQSRRGMLELDLVLDKFWRHGTGLSDAELRVLSELLALEDGELWREIKTPPIVADSPKNRLIRRLHNL